MTSGPLRPNHKESNYFHVSKNIGVQAVQSDSLKKKKFSLIDS